MSKYQLVEGPNWGQYQLIEEYSSQPIAEVEVGDIVLYMLTEQDAAEINRRRTNPVIIKERIDNKTWPIGAQAHIGNEAQAGQELPMVITRMWSQSCVNGQVFLDGNDTLWKTSVLQFTNWNKKP